jgi:hypothetical protein
LGEYADPDWYARAEIAARCKGRQMQDLQQALGKLPRRPRVALPEGALDREIGRLRRLLWAHGIDPDPAEAGYGLPEG